MQPKCGAPGARRSIAEQLLVAPRTAAELVSRMADAGLRHVAVVDAQQRLCGIISQSDLVAALYRGGLSMAGSSSGAA